MSRVARWVRKASADSAVVRNPRDRVGVSYSHFSSRSFGLNGSFLGDTLVAKDPPEHRKLRNLVNQAFTPRAVAHLSGRIEQITQELLDQVRDKGQMDVVSDIAFPLPAKIIAEMLGVPDEDWGQRVVAA